MQNHAIKVILKENFPRSLIRPACQIDKNWRGVALTIDWLLIVITHKGVNGSSYFQVDAMGTDYPFEPCSHKFKEMSDVVIAIQKEIETLNLDVESNFTTDSSQY